MAGILFNTFEIHINKIILPSSFQVFIYPLEFPVDLVVPSPVFHIA